MKDLVIGLEKKKLQVYRLVKYYLLFYFRPEGMWWAKYPFICAIPTPPDILLLFFFVFYIVITFFSPLWRFRRTT